MSWRTLSQICIFLILFSCGRAATTDVSRFFIPNFSSSTIGRYNFSNGKLYGSASDIRTGFQPTSVAVRKDRLIATSWGGDRLWNHKLSAGSVTSSSYVDVQSFGLSKPHHIILHPTLPFAYITHESNPGYVSVWHLGENGAITLHSQVSLAGSRTSTVSASADFRFIYASSPGDGKIYVFSVDGTGQLSQLQAVPTGGIEPYMAVPVPNRQLMAVIHLTSDNLIFFDWEYSHEKQFEYWKANYLF